MSELVVPVIIALSACALTLLAAKQWRGERYLCDDCRFNDPGMCMKKERPKAVDCTAYHAIDEQTLAS